MVTEVDIDPDPQRRIRKLQGEQIRKLRTFRGMTVAELAHEVGVTQGAVSQWELGRHTPGQTKQVRIAEVLDVPWSSIFGLDGVAV